MKILYYICRFPCLFKSPEEILRRKRRAKLRFKAVARIAYSNRYWLNDVADEVLGDNVHRNVAMLLKKRKGAVQSIPLQVFTYLKF